MVAIGEKRRTYRRHGLAQEHGRINEVDVARQIRRNRVLGCTNLRDSSCSILKLHESGVQERIGSTDGGLEGNVGTIRGYGADSGTAM